MKKDYIRIMKDFGPTVCISVCSLQGDKNVLNIVDLKDHLKKKHGFVLEKAKFTLFKEYTKNGMPIICFFTKYLETH